MDPDDHVCLCFHVSLRKIANFIAREEPTVASQISECLGAGTGCQWCVPFLKKLHALHANGQAMDLPVSPEEYARRRSRYRKDGQRDGAESDIEGESHRSTPSRVRPKIESRIHAPIQPPSHTDRPSTSDTVVERADTADASTRTRFPESNSPLQNNPRSDNPRSDNPRSDNPRSDNPEPIRPSDHDAPGG